MLSKSNTPKQYPTGKLVSQWWRLFDEYENSDLKKIEIIKIGVSRGLSKATGNAQRYRWEAHKHYYGAEVKPVKPVKPALPKPATQSSNEESLLLAAYQDVFDAEDAYLIISKQAPAVAEAALRSLHRAKAHRQRVLASMNFQPVT